jgi:phytoene dehydrogenase-like protein
LAAEVIIVGSGPNGLSAAIALAESGVDVLVIEGASKIGGGTRTDEITLPGFRHDLCSAVHPMGVLSPYWKGLALEAHGLEWVHPRYSVAHPLDDGRAMVLAESIDETCERLGADGPAWRRMVTPFLGGDSDALLADLLAPLGVPRRPITMARFGMKGVLPAKTLARMQFDEPGARALFAGLAGHSILPLSAPLSGAVGLVFAVTGHLTSWPVARGGSSAIAEALASKLRAAGGRIECDRWIRSLDDLPEDSTIIFDTSPGPMVDICGEALPASYRSAIDRYEYGPGTFKVDFALSERIPWTASECHEASTVHVGGTLAEIAFAEREPWRGRHAPNPYLIVCQQSNFDSSRAPDGQHTGYAYCHVPNGSDQDMTDAIIAQIERFAPGFRETILAKKTWSPADFEAHNPNYVGGAITGGAANWSQLFTRPVPRLNPYSTPNPRIFIGSASSPPGGGVHGMCGWYAAQSVLKKLGKRRKRLAA